MASSIQITPEELRTQSQAVRDYKTEQEEVMQKITNLILTIGEVWTGEAQVAFINKYQSMQPVFTSFANALDEFADLMQTAANDMESTDKKWSQIIKSLS